MRKDLLFILLGMLAATSCVDSGKYPLDPPIHKQEPAPEPEPGPDPTPVPVPEPEFGPMAQAFKEDFASKTPEFFVLDRHESDFRYFSGFPSIIEKNSTILLLRLDKKDKAGAWNGSRLENSDYCTYGSYGMRLRVPDTKAAQSSLNASAVLGIYDEDNDNGLRNISIEIKLSEPGNLYLKSQNTETKVSPSGFNAATAFRTVGFDWEKEKIVWWVMSGSTKTTIHETAVADDIPTTPAHLRFGFHHLTDAGAPKYPYELELDWISYEPTE